MKKIFLFGRLNDFFVESYAASTLVCYRFNEKKRKIEAKEICNFSKTLMLFQMGTTDFLKVKQ